MKPGRTLLIALLLTASSGVVLTAQPPEGRRAAGTTGDVASAAVPRRRVLALYSEASDNPVNVSFVRQFHAVLKQQSGNTIEHYTEYFESARFPDESQARIMRDYLRGKYADRKIDVVFAWGPFTLQFVLKYHNELFPGTPIVYFSLTLDEVRNYSKPAMTGVLSPDTYERTLDLALTLHPDTKEVFIISGTPARDKAIEHDVSRQLEKFQSRVKLTYLTDLPFDRLLATVKRLPPKSVIIYSRQQADDDDSGRILQQSDYLDLVSRSAPVPVYGPWRSLLGHGSVGGVVNDVEIGATQAAEIVLRVANGTPPQEIPPEFTPRIPAFDWRQLKRWGIDEDRLPPGSLVLSREPTLWGQYWRVIVATGMVLGVQSALIATLLVQRARRRRVEMALRESEQRYAIATAAGSVGVWDWNLETGVIYVDPALKRVLGFADDEIENRVEAWSRHVHPEDADRLSLEARTHIERATPFFELERRMMHRDGGIRWFLTRGSAVCNSLGGAIRVTGTDTDITERRYAEARLEEAHREYTRIARVTTLAQFAASIAHEVSQPLGAILMNSKACLQWLAGTGMRPDELRAALEDIVEAANRAKHVVTRDRELFRQRTGEKQVLDLKRIVRDVAALARTRLQQSSVSLTMTFDDVLPSVVGDGVELQQVLLNLVLNGIEALETIEPALRRLIIEARPAGKHFVLVTVRDTGLGLRDVDTDRLFTPFYTTKPAGTGVGLSLSRSIVEAHGGQLWAEPDAGPGATFRFTLPVAADQASGATRGRAAPHERESKAV